MLEDSVNLLHDAMREVEPYPAGVIAMPGRIPGTAFFPGGDGLYRLDNETSQTKPRTIMILGHDFDSKAGFDRSLTRGSEVVIEEGRCRAGPTWCNLLSLLMAARISPSSCFFTNAYMGLREISNNTGQFPGAKDERFRNRCEQFLAFQISIIRPRAIFTLGSWVPPFIAPLATELTAWRGMKTIKRIDSTNHAVIPKARFAIAGDLECSLGVLTHPSLRGPNVHRRCYANLEGNHAELAIIDDVLKHAGLH